VAAPSPRAGGAKGSSDAVGRAPPPLPFDFEEEQRLQAALDAERAQRLALEQQLGSLVAEVGEAAGLAPAPPADAASSAAERAPPAAAAPAPPDDATAAAQVQMLLERLRTHAQQQAAAYEEQRFALDLAAKEKGMLESRAMLGRRHRTASSAAITTAAASPAEKAVVAAGLNKENAGDATA
jgi:hypothetical protein